MRVPRCACSLWTFLVCRRIQLFFPFRVSRTGCFRRFAVPITVSGGGRQVVSLWTYRDVGYGCLLTSLPPPTHTFPTVCGSHGQRSCSVCNILFLICAPPKITSPSLWVTVCYHQMWRLCFIFLSLLLPGKDLSSRSEDDLSCIFGKRQKATKMQVNEASSFCCFLAYFCL